MWLPVQDAEKPAAEKDDAPADTNKEEVTTIKAASEAKTEPSGDAVNGASTAAEKSEVVADAEKPEVSAEAMDVDVKPVRLSRSFATPRAFDSSSFPAMNGTAVLYQANMPPTSALLPGRMPQLLKSLRRWRQQWPQQRRLLRLPLQMLLPRTQRRRRQLKSQCRKVRSSWSAASIPWVRSLLSCSHEGGT